MKTLAVSVPMTSSAAPDRAPRWNAGHAIGALVLLILLLLPLQQAIYLVFVMKVLCFALFACGLNLLLGYGGLLSFGHAVFFGSAAYATAHACKVVGAGPGMGLLLGVAASCTLGLLVGLLAIRRQGIYFAMVTLALAQLVYFIVLQMPFTNGEDGIQDVPRGRLFGLVDLGSDTAMYYVVVAVFVAGYALVYRVVHSPFGEVLQAIRENEARAISLGYRVNRFKLTTFVLSAGLAGLAGSTKALVFQIATLSDVHWHASGEVVLMTLLGGVGTLFGPVVGAALVVTLQNVLAGMGSWSTVVIGLVFIVCVLVFRRGVVGELVARVRWPRRRT